MMLFIVRGLLKNSRDLIVAVLFGLLRKHVVSVPGLGLAGKSLE